MKVNNLLLSAAVVLTMAACGPKPTSEPDVSAVESLAEAKPVESAAVALVEVVANDNCGINAPTPGAEFDKAKILSVWGYAFDKSNWTVPVAVTVRVASLEDDQKVVVPASRGSRKDIADALNHPEIENSGFGAEVDVSILPAGSYMVSVLQEIDGKAYVCNNPLPISLK